MRPVQPQRRAVALSYIYKEYQQVETHLKNEATEEVVFFNAFASLASEGWLTPRIPKLGVVGKSIGEKF